jgi:predicted nucleic acid-binding protein
MPSSSKKPLVYLETSFISYLVSDFSANEKTARWQLATRRWWNEEGPKCRLFVSDVVLREAEKGDSGQVVRRLEVLGSLDAVETNEESLRLARKLLEAHAIPPNSTTDALHVAIATIYKANLLLSWNCRHIANSSALPNTDRTILESGYDCPAIETPEQQ